MVGDSGEAERIAAGHGKGALQRDHLWLAVSADLDRAILAVWARVGRIGVGFDTAQPGAGLSPAPGGVAELGGGGSSSTLNTAVQLYGAHSSFAHPRFLRGREELLPTMKPRSSKKPKKAANGATPRSLEADTSLGADETDEDDFAL